MIPLLKPEHSCVPKSMLPCSDQQAHFHLTQSKINFLKKIPEPRFLVPAHAEEKPVEIHYYSDISKFREDFNFRDHGFEHCTLESDLLEHVKQFLVEPYPLLNPNDILGTGPRKIPPNMLNCANAFLSSWKEKNGIQGEVICINFDYRSAVPKERARSPFSFAHADFDKDAIEYTKQILKWNWKPMMEVKKGPMSDKAYDEMKVTTIVNLWIPLNDLPTTNTLALMVRNSPEHLFQELKPVRVAGLGNKPTALGLEAGPDQKWVALKVKLGDAYIFNSMKVPHTAVNIEGALQGEPCADYRKSIELRFAVIETPLVSNQLNLS